jgi:hypothetical protein
MGLVLTCKTMSIFLGAENGLNLFTLTRSNDLNEGIDDKGRLETVGEYHVGELINKFKRGNLLGKNSDTSTIVNPSILYGTVDGTIGVISQLTKNQYDVLKVQFSYFPRRLSATSLTLFLFDIQDVETALTKVINGVGGKVSGICNSKHLHLTALFYSSLVGLSHSEWRRFRSSHPPRTSSQHKGFIDGTSITSCQCSIVSFFP